MRCSKALSYARYAFTEINWLTSHGGRQRPRFLHPMEPRRPLSSSGVVLSKSVEQAESRVFAAMASSNLDEALRPTEEDYRALLLDLVLYRKETLRPVVDAIQQERFLLDAQMRHLDEKVRELSAIREDIRSLLERCQQRDAEMIRQLWDPPAETVEKKTVVQSEIGDGEDV